MSDQTLQDLTNQNADGQPNPESQSVANLEKGNNEPDKSQVNPEKEPEQTEQQGQESKEEHQHKNGWQKRVDKLTARNYRLESELSELKNVIQQLIPQDDEGKPTIQINRQNEQYAQAAEWNEKLTEASTAYQDWDAVIKTADKIPVTPALQKAIQESDFGGHIIYELAKNPNVAATLIHAPESVINRTIGRLEAQIEARISQPVQRQQPKTTKAPPPIDPVKPSGSVEKDPTQMTTEEYVQWRRSGKK